ncbi:MAG: hypothetical protein ACERIG_07385 [Hyphomicrobium sp.]
MAQGQAPSTTSWGRVVDYIFGRNTLIGFASLMLLVISGFATWHGMRDFVLGVSSSPGSQEQQLPGGLAFSNDILVIVVVATLTFLMWLALRETFGAQRRLTERLITLPLYLFLAVWSIGFGYGFWWSLIAGEEATRTSLTGLQEDARDAASAIDARLAAVQVQLDSVVTWSDSQMTREETSGGSCGRPSGAGRGPLYNARRSVRDSVASLRDSIENAWVKPVKVDLKKLQKSAAGLGGGTIEQRQQRFEAMASGIRGNARSIAARSNELGKSTAAEMRALAAAVSIPLGQTGFSCYDPTLAQRLTQAANQADQPIKLNLREATFNEGPAGVANAIKHLWQNIGAYLSSLANYIVSGGKDTGDADSTGGTPIDGRSLIALLATIGVDLGLLALTALNPPSIAPLRRDAMARSQAQIPHLTGTVIRQIAGAIETAIARAPGADLEWVRKHFIYHDGASYFIIPNLYSVAKDNKAEERRALAINQLGGVLSELDLVRTLSESELRRARQAEDRESRSASSDQDKTRNHGLFSKGRRALAIAGWSEDAQKDIEVFRLVQREGLTPILTVLSEAKIAKADDVSHKLTHEETRKAYIEHLSKGLDIEPALRPVLEKIDADEGGLSGAIVDFFQAEPAIEQHVSKELLRLSKQIAIQDDAITKEWVADPKITYLRSELEVSRPQDAIRIFYALKVIRDDLGRKSSHPELRAKIDEFLSPASPVTAQGIVEAMKTIGA